MGKPTGRNGREHMSQSGTRASFKRPLVESQIVKSFHCCSKARQFAGHYIDSLEERPVFPGEKSLQAMHALVEPLPENPSDPFLVLDQLQEIGAPAVVTQTGGRYFGFVNGGILPVGLAARWMADVWDQNTAHYVMSPINSSLEEMCKRWIAALLGFS